MSTGRKTEALRIVSFAIAVLLAACAWLAWPTDARAVEAVRVSLQAKAIDLAPMVERYRSDGDEIRISTAPGRDGIVRRIAVKARDAGTQPDWIVFALTNDTDEQVDRLLVAPHFRLTSSGVVWPDLGSSRIAAITASEGIRPEREDSPDADVFLITLDPGTTVTFVAELRSSNLPQVYLWQADAYKERVNGLTLYKGIIIGIAGLLALFLTIVFVVKGALIFPAAAALAWAVLAYSCIDFGFFQRIFPISETAERIYRAGAEAVLAATLLVFLFAYLNLNRWHVRYSHVTAFWLVFLGALVALAVFDPPVASGVARISIAAVAGIGFVLVIHLATHGYDRAVMLVPTWVLLIAWVTAAGFTVMGQLTTDLVPPALIGGLVLIVMLIGFTVMQHAFAGGSFAQGLDERHRAPGARAFRRGRRGVRLGRDFRPHLRQPRGGASARTEARVPRRSRLGLARRDPPLRPGPLPGLARCRHRAAPRTPHAGLPPALGLRPAPLVPPQGAPGDRLGRRGHPHRRDARRRDRLQDRRGAPAPRRGPRQPHEPAEPPALLRPARSGADLREPGRQPAPDRAS